MLIIARQCEYSPSTRDCSIVLRGSHFHLCCGVLMAFLYSGLLIMEEKIICNGDVEANKEERKAFCFHLENSLRKEGI